MQNHRYIKFILTIIALELLWLGAMQSAPPAAAQATATRVIIAGVQMDTGTEGFVPVGIVGGYRAIPETAAKTLQPFSTRVDGDVTIQARAPLRVVVNEPLKIATDQPLLVRQVDYTPRARPGE